MSFFRVHSAVLSSKRLRCNHSGSNSALSLPLKRYWFPFVILNPEFQQREPLDGLWLRPSALTVRVCGDYKAGPALVVDLRGRCGVLLWSLQPQQFYSHFSPKCRGHGGMMQEIQMERSLCLATDRDSHHWLSGRHIANKIVHRTAAECTMNYINAALLDNQTLFLSQMELESQTSLWFHSRAAYQLR